jgi:hypothetical protein
MIRSVFEMEKNQGIKEFSIKSPLFFLSNTRRKGGNKKLHEIEIVTEQIDTSHSKKNQI